MIGVLLSGKKVLGRFIWDSQLALQTKLCETWSEHPNLPFSPVIIMLLLLGLPLLTIQEGNGSNHSGQTSTAGTDDIPSGAQLSRQVDDENMDDAELGESTSVGVSVRSFYLV